MSISFSHFKILCLEALDRTDLGSMTVRRERDPQSRRKSAAEIKRTQTVIDPKTGERKTVPVVQKPRSDIGKSREAGKSTAQIGAVDRSVDPKERAAKAAAAAKEERRKAALARRAAASGGSSESKPAAKPESSKEAEKKATELLRKDVASKKPETSSAPKGPYKRHDYGDAQLTTTEKRAVRDKSRNAAKGKSQQEIKSQLIADFVAQHGRQPKGKERTQIVAKSHAAAKAT